MTAVLRGFSLPLLMILYLCDRERTCKVVCESGWGGHVLWIYSIHIYIYTYICVCVCMFSPFLSCVYSLFTQCLLETMLRGLVRLARLDVASNYDVEQKNGQRNGQILFDTG